MHPRSKGVVDLCVGRVGGAIRERDQIWMVGRLREGRLQWTCSLEWETLI